MEQSEHKERVKREFFVTLKYLASEPDVVIEANDPGCVTYDLFEDYKSYSNSFLGMHGGEIDTEAAEQIKVLTSFMNDMPNDDFVCFENSMLSRPNWNNVRQMARDILLRFNILWDEVPKYTETEPGIWKREK